MKNNPIINLITGKEGGKKRERESMQECETSETTWEGARQFQWLTKMVSGCCSEGNFRVILLKIPQDIDQNLNVLRGSVSGARHLFSCSLGVFLLQVMPLDVQ